MAMTTEYIHIVKMPASIGEKFNEAANAQEFAGLNRILVEYDAKLVPRDKRYGESAFLLVSRKGGVLDRETAHKLIALLEGDSMKAIIEQAYEVRYTPQPFVGGMTGFF